MKILLIAFLGLAAASQAYAAIQTQLIEYKDGEVTLEGYLAYDDAGQAQRPGVIVVHDWMGFGSFAHTKAEELAKLGYVALAIDIYGKDVRPRDTKEAAIQAGIYKGDRALMRRRARAGYDVFKNHPLVAPGKIAMMGYCFGGTVSLELARSGAPLRGVVSFHGGLSTPDPGDARQIKAKILALHGADDPYVPMEEVQTFQKEMRDANVDWAMISYGGAVHSFTNPAAGADNSKGAAYHEKADQRSWGAMRQFFEEIFK